MYRGLQSHLAPRPEREYRTDPLSFPAVTTDPTAQPPASLAKRVGALLAQQPMRNWSMVFGVVAVAISGLFGGWQPAPPKPPATVNTQIDGGAWKVTVTGVRAVGELKPMVLSDKENHWLVVVADVEITAEKSWTNIGGILELTGVDGVDGERAAGVVLMRDARRINLLHPGMPEKVAFFWEQRAGTPLPTEVTVRVTAREYRENSLTKADEWMPDDKGAVLVRAPVVDKREAAA